MTHAEAIRGNGALQPVTVPDPSQPGGVRLCDGELELLDTVGDRVAEKGRMVDRLVTLYRCAGCGYQVSMSGHLALNHYRPLPRPEMIRALAERMNGADPRAQRED